MGATDPLVVILTSLVPSTAVGLWTVYQWLSNRKDREWEREEKSDERRSAEIERERKMIYEQHAQIIVDLRSEIDRYRRIVVEKNEERFYAWDRARWWHQKAWDMRNEAAQARQIVESMERLTGQPRRVWDVSLDMPPFDDHVKAPSRQTA